MISIGMRRGAWWFAAVYFVFMMACYFGASAMIPPIRHQMASIHSLFWTFALPWSAAACAVLSAAVGFAANWLRKRGCVRPQSS
jgi:hypothetical protein